MAPIRDPRVANAFHAMKRIGIEAEIVKPVLKRLFKLYGRKWELIEEDNYRTLADAIFEEQDDKLKGEKKGNMIDEDAEPPLKRLHRGDSKDQILSVGDKGKGIIDLDENEVPKSSSRKIMAEVPQSDIGDFTNEPHHFVNESPSGSKRRVPIQVNSASSEKNSCTHPAYANNEINDPDSLDHKNKNTIVPWERQAVDSRGEVIPGVNGDRKKAFHLLNDITKGTEKVKISLLDEIGNEDQPHFVYSPENTTYESACVQVSLARISDEDCCSDCIGDCLSSSIPCACARNTGGEYAYTPEGLLDEKFLKFCIHMKISPKSNLPKHTFYCHDCPLERAKNARRPGKCRGHLLRKFIKECWRKCGCSMMCGNRVVQRGITRNLQVFLTGEGKGWGLRTLEELPEGAFVCEYVGEILTNMELYERNNNRSGEDKHIYPVLLDADWATEGTLKDEDALCLDATDFGNVARFINHRCYDGNLIDVPVQVETPDRHYYHVAFFTARKVNALEELTWDYEIDFDDNKHPVKAFRCCCGSPHCRDKKGRR